jgi:hypothetical protein
MQKEIDYIKIPWSSIGRLMVALIFLFLTCIFIIYAIPSGWRYLKIGEETEKSIHQIFILFYFLIAYILASFTLLSFVAWIKKGFQNLKNYKEDGLIERLIVGLILWLIGIIVVVMLGWFIGMSSKLLFYLLTAELSSYIFCWFWGLIKEFK